MSLPDEWTPGDNVVKDMEVVEVEHENNRQEHKKNNSHYKG